jgi:hypothetical protein
LTDPVGPSCLHCIAIVYICVCLLHDKLCLNGDDVSLVPNEDTTSQASDQIYVLVFLPRGMIIGYEALLTTETVCTVNWWGDGEKSVPVRTRYRTPVAQAYFNRLVTYYSI